MWPKRYSIRGLLLLMAFVAAALVLWLERHNSATSSAGRIRLQVSGERASTVNTITGEVAAGGSEASDAAGEPAR
jgi:hypothetical protein